MTGGTKKVPESSRNEAEEGGALVKSLVFGGLDGIITTFAIVATVAGARAHAGLVLLMGVANLIADALSMGIGDFLSERAEDEYVEGEYRREIVELRQTREWKKRQLEASYVRAGLEPAAAQAAVEAVATVDDVFVAHSMLMRLELLAPGNWRCPTSAVSGGAVWMAAKKGATTAGAFVAFGATPLAAYYATVTLSRRPLPELMFTASCVVTTTTLLALGAAKARLTNQPILESAVGMVVNGGAAAIAAFSVGRIFEDFEGWHDLAATGRPFVLSEPASSESSVSVVALETGVASLFAVVGALPTFYLSGRKELPNGFVGLSNAFAGGAVASISLALAADAVRDGRSLAGFGFLLGLASAIARVFFASDDDDQKNHEVNNGASPVSALAVALASHSTAEGLALGAAYAHSYARGRAAALSILVHNVPEGLATATVLVGRGRSPAFAALCAYAAAAPQTIGAIIASASAGIFADLSGLFVGFAAAMMLWIAFSELLPDALDAADKPDGPTRDLVALVASSAALAVSLFLV
ncbi:hypothetical protein CTAYLR_005315 [Chrysophaeum taylorii]|uniref:Uncharacterized protein n=1 Tax=Chrysophaeum taylorii TaxID=2483200 RepID=A0AAD7UJE0_9STRA|nr:hypothetical protein CTAYLR_005315 [Chrysophaeum taylorii]